MIATAENTGNTVNTEIRFRRGQTIFFEGDDADGLFRLESGFVRIAKLTPRGRVVTLRHIMPGDCFGEEAFAKQRRDHNAEALTDVVVTLLDVRQTRNENFEKLNKNFADQFSRLMRYEYHLQIGDLRQRVARYILELARTPLANTDQNNFICVRATHELIAEGTNSTRESVSKIITDLRAEGLLQSGYRRITLLNLEVLETLAIINDLEEKN